MIDHKPEGVHAREVEPDSGDRPIVMGPDRLLDDQTFTAASQSRPPNPTAEHPASS